MGGTFGIGSINSPNLLPRALQEALSRARPSPLPSNMVITLVEGPRAPTQMDSTVSITLRQVSGMVWGSATINPNWVWNEGQWK